MKKVFNKVIAVAATVPLALTQGFAVLSNAADATTISVERVLEIKPQELESDWAKLVEGALIDSEGKSFELNVADIIDSADFSDKNAAYVEKVQKCIVGNPSVSIQNSVAVMTAQVDATSYVQSNIIDAIKKELTKQGAASIIDDIDFSMLEKKGTFTAAVDGDSIENTAANKAAGTANTIRVKGAVFVDSEGNQVATYADAKAYAASTVQKLKVELTKKAAAAGVEVNLDSLLATYQKKVEKAFSYVDKAIAASAHEKFATADETLAWIKAQKEKKTTRFDVPGSVADLAKYGNTLDKAVAEINKAFQKVNVDYTVAVSMDDVTSLLNSGSDFTVDADADTNVYTVTFKVPDTDVDADYFSTVEGIEKYYAAHPDQAETDGVTDADYSQLVYDSSYKLVTAQGDADNDTLAGVPSGYFNVERIIKFKDKATTTTTTDISGTTTTDVSGTTTTDVSGGTTTTDVSGGTTTTDVSGGTTTTDVSGGTTTTDVSGGTTTTDVSGGTTTTDVSGGTTTTDVSGGTTTTDVSGATTTTTTGTGDSETTTTTTTTNTGTITPVGTTTLEVEVNPTNFYFSVDERELKPSDLFSKFDIVDEDGTHFNALELGAVTLDKTTPKEIFDAEGKPYCVTEVNAYFTDPTKADAEPVAAPVNPTVYIGVKGDTDLSGLVDVPDAVAVLTYTAKIAAGQEGVVFNEDENLNKFVFFLADIDTESKEGKNDGNKLMATEDAVYMLTYTAKTAAGQEVTWPDVIPSLKSLEGSIWYEG
ncbi:cellulose-binding protein CttA-related protein [Ruminococcus sp.]|uniref:cellulose-binding protein CttA-related protein n=1 Tax=Ruminococcus sp. TaxID=41978 RepID=UPI003995D72F